MTDLSYQPVIDKARELFDQSPEDSRELWTLLEFDDYQPAIEKALSLMKTATSPDDCLVQAGALMKRNPEKFYPFVEEYIRAYWNHKHAHILIAFCAEQAPELMLPLISEWIASRKRRDQASELMEGLTTGCSSKAVTEFVWTWCKQYLPSSDALNFLQRFLMLADSSTLPREALDYAVAWLKNEQGHASWSGIFASTFRISVQDPRMRLENFSVDKISEQQKNRIMLEVFKYSVDRADLSVAHLWREQNPTNQVALAALAVACERFPSEELLKAAKSSLPTGDKSVDRRLQSALSKAGDDEAIAALENWLMEKQIIRRWNSRHRERGLVMASLIEGGQFRPETFELAKEWLVLIPFSYEVELHGRLKQAVNQYSL